MPLLMISYFIDYMNLTFILQNRNIPLLDIFHFMEFFAFSDNKKKETAMLRQSPDKTRMRKTLIDIFRHPVARVIHIPVGIF
jgi:hypothetical protein